MALSSLHTTHAAAAQPAVRKIGLRDIADAILAGIEDFAAKPTHLYFLGVIYPLVTLGAFLVVFNYDLLPLVFPVISGSLLVGPLLTIAMCEIAWCGASGHDRVRGAIVTDSRWTNCKTLQSEAVNFK